MEIPEIILEKALSIFNNSSVNEELSALLKKLESKTIEEVLKVEEDEEVWRIDNDIRKVVTDVLYSAKTENEKTQGISDLIFTEQNYLKRGLENANVKLILIFLSVNCYLKIDIKRLLSKSCSIESISSEILKILQNINVEVQALPDAPYYEIKMMKNFQQGILDGNINNAYQFVEVIEKGGRGFHFNFLLEHLISFLYQLNYSCFLEHISKIDNLQKFIFYLQGFKIEQLIRLSNEPSLTNKWLNFELIRQITEKEQKDKFEENECIALKNILTKINISDFDFLKQTIQYFRRSKLFNAALADLFILLSGSKTQDILSECFVIDQYTFNYESRKELFERFKNNASELQTKEFITIIYEKWQSYFNRLLNSEDFYLNDVLLTDFCDFIALYYISFATEEDVITQMTAVLKDLIYIDSQWFASKSKQLTTFLLFYSKLYLLSFAYKEKHLNNTCIITLFSKMKSDNMLSCRYLNDKIMKSLSIIEENLR